MMKPFRTVVSRSLIVALVSLQVVLGPNAPSAFAGNYDFSRSPAHPSAAQASNARTAFQTDEFTGSFGYQIPIDLPPGRSGATPQLALSYGSGGSNGWLGVGWSLDVGYIERSGRDGVPIKWAASGSPRLPVAPLQYDDANGFVFSFRGESSRLVNVAGSEWRAEIDKSALKFILSTNGWTVYAKDGSLHTFGFTSESANSRMDIPASEGPATGNAKTFRWGLSASQDATGNRIVYEYAPASSSAQQHYLQTIRYNGHTSQATNQFTHTVEFALQAADRPDISIGYRSGYRVETRKRLHTITTKVSGVRAKQYELLYTLSPSSGRTLLTQVKEYGEAGTTTVHSPIQLTYQAASLAFGPVTTWGNTSGQLLHQSGAPTQNTRAWNALSWKASISSFGPRAMLGFQDLDRDGLPERVLSDQVFLVGAGSDDPPNTYLVQHSTGAGLDNVLDLYNFTAWQGQGGPSAQRGALGYSGTETCNINTSGEMKLIDINGDGYVDRVHDWRRFGAAPTLTQQMNFYVEFGHSGTGNGGTDFGPLTAFGPTIRHPSPTMTDTSYAYSPWNTPEYSLQDCDQQGGFPCNIGGCSPFDSVGVSAAMLMDINGDGKPDRVLRRTVPDLATRDEFFVQLNTGTGFGALQEWAFEDQYVAQQYFWNNPFTFLSTTTSNTTTPVGMFDINGDGLPDRVMRKFGNCGVPPPGGFNDFIVQYNKGYEFENGSAAETFGPLEMPPGVTGIDCLSYASPSSSEGGTTATNGSFTLAMLQDVNGDGLLDRIVHDVNFTLGGWTPAMWVQFNNGSGLGTAQPFANVQVIGQGSNSQYPGPWHYPQGSTPVPWITESAGWSGGQGNMENVLFVDVNGDKLPDRVMSAPTTTGNPGLRVQLATGDVPDLLERIDNGLGALISVQYTPSTQWVNRHIDIPVGQTPWQANAKSLLGSVMHTTTSVTVEDGINPAAITTYQYFGGMYDYADREFRGFHKTTKTDASGAYTITWFHQDGGMDRTSLGEFADASSNAKRGKPFRIESYDSANFPYQVVIHKVDEVQLSTGRWFPFVAQTATQNYEKLATPRTTVERFEYFTSGASTTNFKKQTSVGEVGGFNASTHNYSTNTVATDDLVREFTYAVISGNAEIRDRVDFEYFKNSVGTIVRQTDSDYNATTGTLLALKRWRDLPTPAWLTETFTYDVYGNVVDHTRPGPGTLTNPSGAGVLITQRTEWDLTYRVFPWRVTEDHGTGTFNYVATTVHDQLSGQVLTSEDWNGVITRNVYDNFHRIDEVWLDLPSGGGSIWQQDYEYLFTGVSSGLSSNRIKRVVNDTTDATPSTLEAPAVGHETYTYSDGLGRVIQARVESERTSPQLLYRVADTRFDSRGNVHKQTREHFEPGSAFTTLGPWPLTQTDFDALGRATRLTPPVGDSGSPTGFQTTEYSFGTNPWVRVIKDGKKNSTGTGSEVRQYRDAFGRIDRVDEVVTGGAVQTTRYEYDVVGNLTKIIDAGLNETTITYDSLGRQLTSRDPDLTNKSIPTSQLSTSYFDDDSVKSETDGKDQRTDHLYDRLRRVVETKTYLNGSSTPNEALSYLYDVNSDGTSAQFPVFKGQLFKVTDAHGFVRNGYDVRGHVVRNLRNLALTAGNYTTQYTYDTSGRLATLTYPRGTASQAYTYDTGGNLQRIQALSGTGTTNEVFYDVVQFDELRMPEQVTYGNGVVNTHTYYPNSKRLLLSRAKLGTHPDYQNIAYTYDAASNVTSITDSVASHTGVRSGTRSNIQYDLLYRLTSYQRPTASGTQTFAFSYDALGNMLTNADAGTGSYAYPASGPNAVRPHAVTSSPLGTYTYDDAGNMVTRGPAGAVQILGYNARNLLTSVTPATGSAITYGYDAAGKRVWKQVGTAVTVSVGDHYEERARRSLCHVMAEGRRICTFEPIIPGLYEPVEPVLVGQPAAPPPVFDYYHQDQLKTCCVMTNRDGTLAQEYQYTAYGAERYIHNTTDLPLYNRYTDQYWDVESGLYYYGARYYDPALGRFIQADTLTPDVFRPQGLNRYTYVLNNPFRYTDPSGHSWWDSIKSAATNFVKGAVLGDFAGEDLGVAGAIGNIVAGLSPLGVIADVRDFAAAAVDVVQGDAPLSSLASAGAGLIPGVSEGKKLAALAGAAGTTAAAMVKHGDEVAAGAGKATRNGLGEAAARGVASEKRVLDDLGLEKNTGKVSGREGNSIPDFDTPSALGDIKDTKRVDNTRQMRIQREAAEAQNKEHVVITGTHTKVSPTVEQRGTRIVRRDDLGPSEPQKP